MTIGAPPMCAQQPACPEPALWRQIAGQLCGEIGPAGLQPGDRLPTEAQLAARFGVNRHTVRRAMEQLARSGLVRVEQGRGAFVADRVLHYPVTERTRFSETIRRLNKEPSGRVLDCTTRPANAQVAAALGLQPGAGVVLMERLGLADSIPVTLTSHYFPRALLPGILPALQAGPSISAALRAIGIPDYLRKSTRVSARMPTAAEAELLQTLRARPLIICENTNVDPDGRVIEFGITRYPSGRVQVVFEP